MPATVVVDSGPLVALFDKDDRFHADALRFIQRLKGRAVSNLAVVTEVSYLLDFSRKAQLDFWQWVHHVTNSSGRSSTHEISIPAYPTTRDLSAVMSALVA